MGTNQRTNHQNSIFNPSEYLPCFRPTKTRFAFLRRIHSILRKNAKQTCEDCLTIFARLKNKSLPIDFQPLTSNLTLSIFHLPTLLYNKAINAQMMVHLQYRKVCFSYKYQMPFALLATNTPKRMRAQPTKAIKVIGSSRKRALARTVVTGLR